MAYESAQDWDHWYFLGFSKASPLEIEFNPEQLQFLFSTVEAQRVVSGLAAVQPRYLINQKGTTAWLALFAYALINDKTSLAAVSEGRSILFAPASLLRESFSSHVNWPKHILEKYNLESIAGHPFVLPFLIHKSAPSPKDLQRSLRSPNGEIEILGIAEFKDTEPERLLWLFQALSKQIQQQ